MTKGTPSFGRKNKIVHVRCRRCGRHAYHLRKKRCAACGFGATRKWRHYNWSTRTRTGMKK